MPFGVPTISNGDNVVNRTPGRFIFWSVVIAVPFDLWRFIFDQSCPMMGNRLPSVNP
jgi:hypothetical protein